VYKLSGARGGCQYNCFLYPRDSRTMPRGLNLNDFIERVCRFVRARIARKVVDRRESPHVQDKFVHCARHIT
jgi:hypothetical protein